MSTLTIHFNFYLPAQGDGIVNGRIWGLKVNDNFEAIDRMLNELASVKSELPPGGVPGQYLAWPGNNWGTPPAPDPTHASTHGSGGSDALPWSDILGRGPSSDRPPATLGNAGYLWFDTDLETLLQSTGSEWVDYQGAGGTSGGGGGVGANVQVNDAAVAPGAVGVVAIPLGIAPTVGQAGVLQAFVAPMRVDLIPIMTSNTAPSGVASCLNGYDAAWHAFNGNMSDQFRSQGGLPTWLKYQFPSAQQVIAYRFAPSSDIYPGRCPKSWIFQGSNDNVAWTDLDTRTNVNYASLPSNSDAYFPVASPGDYLYYRLYITANNGDATYCALRRVMFMGPSPNLALNLLDPSGARWQLSMVPVP